MVLGLSTEMVYRLAIIGLTPLSFIGVYKIVDIFANRIKVKLGFIQVHRITKNFRLTKKMHKPEGTKLKIKKRPLTFTNKPPYLAFEGVTPVAIYSSNDTQMNLANPKTQNKPDRGYLSNLITEAYNLGIVAAIRQDNMLKFMSLIVIGAAAAAAVMGFLNYQLLSEIAQKVVG